MIYVLWFEDNEDQVDMRARYMTEHLAFLDRNAQSVRAAGPLKDAVGGDAAGGLWLVEA